MSTRSSAFLPTLIGAAVGAAVGYLYFTQAGQRTRSHIEPWLDDLNEELRRVRSIAFKARMAIDEGRQSLEAVWDASAAPSSLSFDEEGAGAS